MMTLESINFHQYSNHKPITAKELQELAREDNEGIIARAEFSGCEGCYIEVCRWNEHTSQYEKFCFEKVFGGELDDNRNAEETAIAIAEQISPLTTDHRLVYSMPMWSEQQDPSSSKSLEDRGKGLIVMRVDASAVTHKDYSYAETAIVGTEASYEELTSILSHQGWTRNPILSNEFTKDDIYLSVVYEEGREEVTATKAMTILEGLINQVSKSYDEDQNDN